ncbi:MAG: phage/plasmid primase, P4 family [Acidobacteria bacterium]|nr:phage/plasmid primase, P4 family [Acidobacteriota bacterium]
MFEATYQTGSFGNESPTPSIAQPSALQGKASEQDAPDRWQALGSFFAAFGYAEDAPIHLRALAPNGMPPVLRRLTRKQIVTDPAVQADLARLNEQRGLYFVVNEGGDKDKNITRFAAWFAEDDGRTIAEQHKRLDGAPLRPSIRIKTRKSVHAYWLVAGDCAAAEWCEMQHRLIAHFDGDKSIDNPSRVMRLPFFDHLSFDAETGQTERVQVELQYFDPTRHYTLEQMRAAFPETVGQTRKQAATPSNVAAINADFTAGLPYQPDPKHDLEIAREALKRLAPERCDERDTWRDVGYALYNTFDGRDEALALYEEWSRLSRKFEEGACAKIWGGASDRELNDLRITLGSLIHWAKEDSPAFTEWFAARNQQLRVERAVQLAEDFGLNDIGNARRLVIGHGENIRYDYKRKMFFWFDGVRWVEGDCAVEQAATETVRYGMAKEAAMIDDPEKRAKLHAHAARSQSDRAVVAMIKRAKSEPEIQADVADFDTQPHLFNVANGTLDLRTGELLPHNRADRLTKLVPIVFDPHAKAPLFNEFLQRIFASNQRMIDYMRRAVGYTLTGDVGAKCFFFCHGKGDNGKSVLLNVIHALTGEHGTAVQTESLMQHKNTGQSGHNEDIAKLRGARFVSASETDEGQRFSHRTLKHLTGRDTITASRKFERAITFTPQFKLWIAGNEKPEINSTDQAMWNRVRYIPFLVTIPKDEQDGGLFDKLKTELSGILAWAAQGAADYYREGLNMPPEVEKATAAYRAEQDTIASFIADECELGESFDCGAQALYDAYRKWCTDAGEQLLDTKAFRTALLARGITDGRSKRGKLRCGIKLKVSGEASPTDSSHEAFVAGIKGFGG